MKTVVERIKELENEIEDHKLYCNHQGAAREFSIALTALEDVQMRFTRGLAKLQGKFDPADLEKL